MNEILKTLANGWGIDASHPACDIDTLNKGLSLTNIESQLINERKYFNEKELNYTSKIIRLENIESVIIEMLKNELFRKKLKKEGITLKYKNDTPYLSFKPECEPSHQFPDKPTRQH